MDEISFREVIKLPYPEWILSIFWETIISFWKMDIKYNEKLYEIAPHSIDDIRLKIDPQLKEKKRYHVYVLREDEVAGFLNESPFWLDFTPHPDTTFHFLDHGDYRHPYQLFLRSVARTIKLHPTGDKHLKQLYQIIRQNPSYTWKCPVCRVYRKWSMDFIESQFLNHGLSVSPSVLLFLFSYQNKALKEDRRDDTTEDEVISMLDIMETALHRFFLEFEKIYSQTSTDPAFILQHFIRILNIFMKDKRLDEIEGYEENCVREMKSFLFNQFKFIKTKSINMTQFPRLLMVIREIFTSVVHFWKKTYSTRRPPSSSPGVFLLIKYMVFPDRALTHKMTENDLIVVYPDLHTQTPLIRFLTPPEVEEFCDYHPLLRPFAFSAHPSSLLHP